MASGFADRVASGDISLFQVESQTTPNDRRSFLSLQNAMRRASEGYVYLECGSHLGGSLLPHLLDPNCRKIYSIDKRPAALPDERGVIFTYNDNRTERMIDTLAKHVPADTMQKLRTFDADSSELSGKEIEEAPDLVLIDAEHTIRAVFSDFLNLSRLCGPSAVYSFHDANLIFGALQNIETFLQHGGVTFDSYILRDSVFVIATNEARERVREVGLQLGGSKDVYSRAVQVELMKMHYEIVRNAQQAAPQGAPPQRR